MSFRRLFRLNFEVEGAFRGTSSVPFFTKLIKNHFNIAIICYAYLQVYLHLDLQKEVLQHVLLAPHVYRARIRNQASTSMFKV